MPVDPELISSWKEQFGAVYSAYIRDEEFVFRAATFAEAKAAFTPRGDDWSAADGEDELVSCCLLYPREKFDRLPAGVITALAEEIQNVSGQGDPKFAKGVMEAKREEVEGVVHLMKAFVIATMPSYTDEQLDDLTFHQLAYKVALAEQIIKVQQAVLGGGNVSLDLIDPDEEVQREQAERLKHTSSRKPGTAGFDDPIARKLHNALGG